MSADHGVLKKYSYLKNEEPLVVEVYSAAFEQILYLGERACPPIDGILAGIVFKSRSRHHEL